MSCRHEKSLADQRQAAKQLEERLRSEALTQAKALEERAAGERARLSKQHGEEIASLREAHLKQAAELKQQAAQIDDARAKLLSEHEMLKATYDQTMVRPQINAHVSHPALPHNHHQLLLETHMPTPPAFSEYATRAYMR